MSLVTSVVLEREKVFGLAVPQEAYATLASGLPAGPTVPAASEARCVPGEHDAGRTGPSGDRRGVVDPVRRVSFDRSAVERGAR